VLARSTCIVPSVAWRVEFGQFGARWRAGRHPRVSGPRCPGRGRRLDDRRGRRDPWRGAALPVRRVVRRAAGGVGRRR